MSLQSGENPGWVAKMLGHTNLTTLFRHYARWIPNNDAGNKIAQMSTGALIQKVTHHEKVRDVEMQNPDRYCI